MLRATCPAGCARPGLRRHRQTRGRQMSDLTVRGKQQLEEARKALQPSGSQKQTWNRKAVRPDARPDARAPRDTVLPLDDSLEERLITTQTPQRPLSTPTIGLNIDGRTVQGLEGQTILETCRDNFIEVPTLCYEPKLPAFGPAGCALWRSRREIPSISCHRKAQDGMVSGPDRPAPPLRKTNWS